MSETPSSTLVESGLFVVCDNPCGIRSFRSNVGTLVESDCFCPCVRTLVACGPYMGILMESGVLPVPGNPDIIWSFRPYVGTIRCFCQHVGNLMESGIFVQCKNFC